MSSTSVSRLAYLYAGSIIVLASIIGGATHQGGWTDHLIEVALIPAMLIGFFNITENRLGILARVLILLAIGLVCLQFLPISRLWPGVSGEFTAPSVLFTPAPLRSLEGALFFLPLVGFTLFVANFSDEQMRSLVRFLLIGLWLNVAAGLLQLSFSGNVWVEEGLPYTIKGGLFANVNHYSTLMFAMIPLLAWNYLANSARPLTYIGSTLILVLVLFATGSRAGMALAAACSVIAFAWFFMRKTNPTLRFGVLMATLACAAIIFVVGFDTSSADGGLRWIYFANTWDAILDNWTVGTGLGTFPMVYPMYEDAEELLSAYVGRAHNDYLQIFLELGIVGIGCLFALFVLLAMKFQRTELAQAAMLSILMVGIHSVVDYPMRTFGIAVPVAYLLAVILSEKQERR
jgi:hypothetical protein